MEAMGFAVVGFAVLAYGLVSRTAEDSIVTPPMVFTALGFAVSGAALGWIDFKLDRELVHLLAEVTLLLVLFTDASRIDLKLLRREHTLPVRLLGIGLPLCILLGALAALPMFPTLGIWGALVLAVILAPTDAALGQAVVTSEKVPVRIRQALNVESGLNDGIALPVLLLFLSIAAATSGGQMAGHGGAERDALGWAVFVLQQIGLGPVAGVLVGWIGAKALQAAHRAGLVTLVFLKLSALALAILAFGAAELVHGNGFIAAFVAGLVMGNVARDICPRLHEFGETEGQLLGLLTFLVFGGLMLPGVVAGWTWMMLLYAVLSLTVLRIVPVALSLIGTGVKHSTCFFIGWFGPRGIASILYALLILEAASFPGRELIVGTMALTVVLSILLHGITAVPFAALYGRALDRMAAREEAMAEHQAVEPMPVRFQASRVASEGASH